MTPAKHRPISKVSDLEILNGNPTETDIELDPVPFLIKRSMDREIFRSPIHLQGGGRGRAYAAEENYLNTRELAVVRPVGLDELSMCGTCGLHVGNIFLSPRRWRAAKFRQIGDLSSEMGGVSNLPNMSTKVSVNEPSLSRHVSYR